MSHVVTSPMRFTDLDLLEATCKEMGLELVRNRKTFRWYGRHVGDYKLPEGFTKEELGKCSHVVRVKGDKEAYEVGLVAPKDGSKGFLPMWDFWGHRGARLQAKVGKNCSELNQAYSVRVLQKRLGRTHKVKARKQKNGKMLVTIRR